MDRKLTEYLPPLLRGTAELEALLSAEQTEAEDLWSALDGALREQFVLTAGEYGLSRREKDLGLAPRDSDTAEERRFRILARLTAELPYTEPRLREGLTSLCGEDGYTLEVKGGEYALTLRVALANRKNFADAQALVRRMAPANLLLDLSLLYEQHSALGAWSHAQLAAWSHDHIRNEVLT